MRNFLLGATLVAVLWACTGCNHYTTVQPTGNVDILAKHTEFGAAAKAAPNFTTEALKIITKLEYELQQLKPFYVSELKQAQPTQ